MLGIEIKHLLEKTCDVTFTVKEIQELKIDDVKMLLEKTESQKMKEPKSGALVCTTSVKIPKTFIYSHAVEPINDMKEGSPIFIIDLDCNDITQLHTLAKNINHPTFALLCSKHTPVTNIESLATWYLKVYRF